MNKKFYLGHTITIGSVLHQIIAAKDIKCSKGIIKRGDLGGYIENEDNLSQEGNCWVYPDARIYDNAKVMGNAVIDSSCIYDHVEISDDVMISSSEISDMVIISGSSIISNSIVFHDAIIENSYVQDAFIGTAGLITSLNDYINIFIDGVRFTFYKTFCKTIGVTFHEPLGNAMPKFFEISEFEELAKIKYPEKYDYMMDIINLAKKKLS